MASHSFDQSSDNVSQNQNVRQPRRSPRVQVFNGSLIEMSRTSATDRNGSFVRYHPLFMTELLRTFATRDWSWFQKFIPEIKSTEVTSRRPLLNDIYFQLTIMKDVLFFGESKQYEDKQKIHSALRGIDRLRQEYLTTNVTLDEYSCASNNKDVMYTNLCLASYYFMNQLFDQMLNNTDDKTFDLQYAHNTIIGIEQIVTFACRYCMDNVDKLQNMGDFVPNIINLVLSDFHLYVIKYHSLYLDQNLQKFVADLTNGLIYWDASGFLKGFITRSTLYNQNFKLSYIRGSFRDDRRVKAVMPNINNPAYKFLTSVLKDKASDSQKEDNAIDEGHKVGTPQRRAPGLDGKLSQ